MDLKIFVSNRIDMDSTQIDNKIYVPVRCGAVYDKRTSQIKGDNTGENISEKRNSYCELTVLYWAWKNETADYIGLCHYRRFLSFAESFEKSELATSEHNNGCIVEQFLDSETIEKHSLINEKRIESVLNGVDAIFMEPISLKNSKCESNYDAIKNAPAWHNVKDFKIMLDVIKEKYPEMLDITEKYMYKYQYSYLYNCFIMKKDIFNEFCSWLFDVLQEIENRIDIEYYTQNQYRTIGTIAERLVGIWALWLMNNKKKIKNVPLIYIENPQEQKEIEPAFEERNIPIAFSSSDEYVPYLSVCLESLKEHISPENNYDILIFERSITQNNKKILLSIFEEKNVKIRFVNPIKYIKGYNLHYECNYNLECYFRLVAPLVLKKYKKVIFTDVDLCFQEDPAKLYEIDIEGYPICACLDLVWGAFLKTPYYDWMSYAKDVLKLRNPFNYFNTGVLLINIPEWNNNSYSTKILELVSKTKYRILEQDGLNVFFQDSIKYINPSWNFPVLNDEYKNIKQFMPYEFLNQYDAIMENPYVIHFAGSTKPWHNPNMDFANIWWKSAMKSPFYPCIIKNMIKNEINESIKKEKYTRTLIKKYPYICLSYWKYKILNLIVNKGKKYKYIQKKNILKDQIRYVKANIK